MSYKILRVALDGSTPKPVAQVGRYFRVLEATGDLAVEVDGGSAGFIQQGIGVDEPEGFEELTFNGAAQTIILGISDAPIDDSRLSVTAPISLAVGQSLGNDAVTATTIATLLDNTGSNRRSLMLYNNGTETVFIGGDAVTVLIGFPLAAGASLTLDKNTQAVYGITASGPSDVRVMREY